MVPLLGPRASCLWQSQHTWYCMVAWCAHAGGARAAGGPAGCAADGNAAVHHSGPTHPGELLGGPWSRIDWGWMHAWTECMHAWMGCMHAWTGCMRTAVAPDSAVAGWPHTTMSTCFRKDGVLDSKVHGQHTLRHVLVHEHASLRQSRQLCVASSTSEARHDIMVYAPSCTTVWRACVCCMCPHAAWGLCQLLIWGDLRNRIRRLLPRAWQPALWSGRARQRCLCVEHRQPNRCGSGGGSGC